MLKPSVTRYSLRVLKNLPSLADGSISSRRKLADTVLNGLEKIVTIEIALSFSFNVLFFIPLLLNVMAVVTVLHNNIAKIIAWLIVEISANIIAKSKTPPLKNENAPKLALLFVYMYECVRQGPESNVRSLVRGQTALQRLLFICF